MRVALQFRNLLKKSSSKSIPPGKNICKEWNDVNKFSKIHDVLKCHIPRPKYGFIDPDFPLKYN